MKLNEDQVLKWHTIFSDNYGSFITDVYNDNLSPHPLIIFYDEYNQRVYYLKGQTYRNQWFYNENETFFYRIKIDKNDKHFKPSPYSNKKYIHNDTIFDTSTIYEMELEEFINYFNLGEKNSYLIVNPEHQFNILKNLRFNFKNDNIALKRVNATLKTTNNKEEIVSKSYYSYVSEEYLIRNFEYENEPINSYNLDSLIKEFDLDVRINPLSYNGIDGIINSAFSDFKYNNPSFALEVNSFLKEERKKEKERSR